MMSFDGNFKVIKSQDFSTDYLLGFDDRGEPMWASLKWALKFRDEAVLNDTLTVLARRCYNAKATGKEQNWQ